MGSSDAKAAVTAALDEVVPIRRHLAPSWGDSVSVRGIRASMSTGSFVTGMFATPLHIHQLEALVHTPGTHKAPVCRVLVYLPPDISDKQEKGVLVHFHGGGWSICNPELEAKMCRYLSDKLNCIVLAPDYAKAPEHYFPYALRQAHGVLNWIAGKVDEDSLGKFLAEKIKPAPGNPHVSFDRTKIALTGNSSGGQIAASTTLLTQQVPLKHGAQVVALGLQYPALNLSTPYHQKLATLESPTLVIPPPWASRLFLRCFLPQPYDTNECRKDKYISPHFASDDEIRKFPPVLICTGRNDHFRVECQEFVERFEELQVSHEFKVFDKVAHAYDTAQAHVSDPARRQEMIKVTEEAYLLLVQHLGKYL